MIFHGLINRNIEAGKANKSKSVKKGNFLHASKFKILHFFLNEIHQYSYFHSLIFPVLLKSSIYQKYL